MSRRNINIVIILILGILFCSVCFSINISYKNENRIKQDEKSIIERQPIEQSLDTTTNNKNEIDTNIDPTSTVSYDLQTGIETIIPSKSYSKLNKESYFNIAEPIVNPSSAEKTSLIENSIKKSEDEIIINDVILPDDRERETSTTIYPLSTICKLYITAADNDEYHGSGFLVDSYHVLTAGHCVFIHDHGGWVRSIEVVPGKDFNNEPYGRAYYTTSRSYTAWTIDENQNHDWALITLDRLIGADTGIMPFRTFDIANPVYSGPLSVAGYPTDYPFIGSLYEGEFMLSSTESGVSVSDTIHWYNMDTYGGMSGGPVWREESPGNLYALSIHAYGNNDGTGLNHGTRINEEKFNRLHAWLREDAIPDMVKSDAGCSSSPVGGNRELEAWCEVRNIGSGETGEITVKYYASEDKKIKDSDTLLGKDTISSIPPLDIVKSSWKGHIYDLPEGEYYIGFIIDENDDIIEFDEDNNKGLCSSDPIKVRYDFIIQFFTSVPGFITIGSVALISIGTILVEKKLIVKR